MPDRFLSHSFVRASALVAGLALTAGCASDASKSAASTSTTIAASSTTAAITVPPTTASAATVPAATAPAPTTTVAPDPLVLRDDGLGPFDYGAPPTAVIDAITAKLGVAPDVDSVTLYEDTSLLGEGLYLSLDAFGMALPYPVGRTMCWDEFCADFGGASEAELAFIGWSFTGPAGLFASSSNLTIGAKWSDFPSMEVFPGCYNYGAGTHHGIRLIVDSPGWTEWLVSDGVGGFVPNLPDPATTRVTIMIAGEQPFPHGVDC